MIDGQVDRVVRDKSSCALLVQQLAAITEGWALEIDNGVDDSIIFQRGLDVLLQHGHLLVAICLNNGYYKRERIKKILEVAAALSKQVTIFFTDGPTKHNYLALGRSLEKTEQQVRKQRHQLRNACDAAIQFISRSVHFNFVDWDDVYDREDYKLAYRELLNLYENNTRFRIDVRAATKDVLFRSKDHIDIEKVVDIGIHYTIEELAFLMIFGRLAAELDHTTTSEINFGYIYHLRWEIFEDLVNGRYDGMIRCSVGFILLNLEPSSDLKPAATSNPLR